MTGRITRLLPSVLLLLAALPALAENPADDHEAHIRARAERDAALMFPQLGVGGDDSGRVHPNKTTLGEFAVPADICPGMTAYAVVPDELPPGRKVALMFVFHGNGDPARGRINNVSRITTARDPVITVGVQYQQLNEDGRGRMNNPLVASAERIFAGCRWLLEKMKADHPVDPERVFVSGFSMGTAWASNWSIHEWRENRKGFPFRAVFLYSSPGAGSRETMPPIPVICTVGENETAVLGTINVVDGVRRYCNVIAHWGAPVWYHEIPGMGHQVNGRCHQITRDVINLLGGPGIENPQTPASAFSPEPSPFGKHDDPLVSEVIGLCDADRWAEAVARVAEIMADRNIPARDKRAVRGFEREIERAARPEATRVHNAIRAAIREEKPVSPHQTRRLNALIEAFGGHNWMRDEYSETLAFLRTDYPPTVRQHEREEQYRQAMRTEQEPRRRNEAKEMYEKLAARANEDGGACVWPAAAAFRLKWWIDGDS